jgi:hypothetical protein
MAWMSWTVENCSSSLACGLEVPEKLDTPSIVDEEQEADPQVPQRVKRVTREELEGSGYGEHDLRDQYRCMPEHYGLAVEPATELVVRGLTGQRRAPHERVGKYYDLDEKDKCRQHASRKNRTKRHNQQQQVSCEAEHTQDEADNQICRTSVGILVVRNHSEDPIYDVESWNDAGLFVRLTGLKTGEPDTASIEDEQQEADPAQRKELGGTVVRTFPEHQDHDHRQRNVDQGMANGHIAVGEVALELEECSTVEEHTTPYPHEDECPGDNHVDDCDAQRTKKQFVYSRSGDQDRRQASQEIQDASPNRG